MLVTVRTDQIADMQALLVDPIPEGLNVAVYGEKRFGIGELFTVTLTFASGLTANVISDWIWSRISKSKGTIRIEIDGKQLGERFDRETIEKELNKLKSTTAKRRRTKR